MDAIQAEASPRGATLRDWLVAAAAVVAGTVPVMLAGHRGASLIGLDDSVEASVALMLLLALAIALAARFALMPRYPQAMTALVWAMLGGALMTGFGVDTRLRTERIRADFRTLSQIHTEPGGAVRVPVDAGKRGPMSTAFIAYFRVSAAAYAAYYESLQTYGMARFADPVVVRRNQALSGDCVRAANVRRLAEATHARVHAAHVRLRAAIVAADIPEPLKRATLITLARIEANRPPIARLDGEQADVVADFCRLLARSNWHANKGFYAFAKRADDLAGSNLIRRLEAIDRQGKAARARMEAEWVRGFATMSRAVP